MHGEGVIAQSWRASLVRSARGGGQGVRTGARVDSRPPAPAHPRPPMHTFLLTAAAACPRGCRPVADAPLTVNELNLTKSKGPREVRTPGGVHHSKNGRPLNPLASARSAAAWKCPTSPKYGRSSYLPAPRPSAVAGGGAGCGAVGTPVHRP
jgi:hypothetical protein